MESLPRLGLTVIVVSLTTGSGIAHAQSSVTLYGVVDAGLRHARGLESNNSGSAGSATALNSGINTTSRLGFRGNEDLGGGLKAIFNLESGVNVDTGGMSNAAKQFDRASWVGLQGGWGSLTLGRQTTLLADAVSAVDPLGSRYAGFNPNIGTAALSAHRLGGEYGPAGATTGAYRLDNSIKYVGRFGDFSVRGMHALGEQGASQSKLSSSGLGATYQAGSYNAAVAYTEFKNANGLTLKGYVGGVGAKLGNGKLSITYGSHKAQTSVTATTRNNTFGVGGAMPLTGSLDLVAAYYRVDRSRSGAADDGFGRLIAFLEYKLSRRTLAYAEVDHTSWKNGYQGPGLKSHGTGVSVGVKHVF